MKACAATYCFHWNMASLQDSGHGLDIELDWLTCCRAKSKSSLDCVLYIKKKWCTNFVFTSKHSLSARGVDDHVMPAIQSDVGVHCCCYCSSLSGTWKRDNISPILASPVQFRVDFKVLLDLLTCRLQLVKIGNDISSTTKVSTNTTHLIPLLFILLTYDWTASFSSNFMIHDHQWHWIWRVSAAQSLRESRSQRTSSAPHTAAFKGALTEGEPPSTPSHYVPQRQH